MFQLTSKEPSAVPSEAVEPSRVSCRFHCISAGRCYELHQEGLSDEDAIVEAVNTTGPVISAAGVIMCLAFLGMLVQSEIGFLCQMGFCMVPLHPSIPRPRGGRSK